MAAELAPVPSTAPVPPQNLEAEESVLGAAMLSAGAIASCREVLRPDGSEFYRESHARIWRAALWLADHGEPVHAITLTNRLQETGELDDIGGRVRLNELARLVPATANASHYARIVAENSELRDIIRAGGELARIGWDSPGGIDEVRERVAAISEALINRRAAGTTQLNAETWAQFERSATEHVPTIIADLWPEGGLGFIAAPPKKGKTWIGLTLAISVAAGKPFLASFQVPKPEPVVLLALEGHRAAIRGRIGCIARGLGLDPDHGSHDLDNLHIVYKPVGLNLNDPAWIRNVRDLVQRVGAKLLIVDVLRAAAVLKENSNDEFRDLLRAMQPLQETGCAIAMLHHFGKLTEISRDRSPGERMAGAGAMYGAFDVGVFITKSDEGARTLRVELETRDLANPDPLGVHLDGDPTGKNGGFVYTDAAYWKVLDDVPEDDAGDSAEEFVAWLEQQPGMRATTTEIMSAWNLTDKQFRTRRLAWIRAGVGWEQAKGGKQACYYLLKTARPSEEPALGGLLRAGRQETLHLQEDPEQKEPARPSLPFAEGNQVETPDLQEQSSLPSLPLSYGEAGAQEGGASPTETGDLEYLDQIAPDDSDWQP